MHKRDLSEELKQGLEDVKDFEKQKITLSSLPSS